MPETEPTRAPAASAAGVPVTYSEGSIAARIDRLPPGWTQWRLVLMSQFMWGCVVGLDAVVGRLYPVVWEPAHFVTPLEYQILLGFSNGLGPLIGNYTFGYLSDRFGRRKVMIAGCLCAGILYIPVAFVKSFPLLLLTITVAAFGVGAAVCLAPTYNTEVSPPAARSKLMLGGNCLAFAMLGIGGSLLALYTLPAHPGLFVYVLALIPIVIMVPVIVLFVPESPRWLESHGRYEQADRIVSRWEETARRKHPGLPEPDLSEYLVPITEKVPVFEVFRGRYLRRTIILLIVWVLLYAGVDYGYGSYAAVYIIDQGWDAHQLFLILLYGGIGGLFALVAGVVLGERVERKTLVFAAGVHDVRGGASSTSSPARTRAGHRLRHPQRRRRQLPVEHVQLHRHGLPDPAAHHRRGLDRRDRPRRSRGRPAHRRAVLRPDRVAQPLELVRLVRRRRVVPAGADHPRGGIRQREAVLEEISR